jgi:probable F420-dependent oxidoreductase
MARFGISIFGERADHVVAMAQLADELGFARIQLGDHVVAAADIRSRKPYQPDRDPNKGLGPSTPYFDVFTTLGAVGAATRHVTVQVGVLIAPLRHPLSIAQAAATVQRISGGRFELGLGSGWIAEEFTALGVPFNERGSRLQETVEVVRAGLRGGVFSHHGKHFDFDDMSVSVEPVHVPILMGGTTEPALRRVARLADGWFNPPVPVEACLEMRDVLERFRADGPDADRPFRYYIHLQSLDGDELASYVDEGFTDITIPGPQLWRFGLTTPLEEKQDMLRTAARELGIRPVTTS